LDLNKEKSVENKDI